MIIQLCLSFIILAMPQPTKAADGYVGLGVGNSRATVDKGIVNFNTQDWKPNVTIWRLFAGYGLNDYFGMEAGYIPLGKARVSTMDGAYYEIRVTGFELTPVASLPIIKTFAVFARCGLIFWYSDVKYYSIMNSGTENASGSSLTVSLGARYFFSRRFGVRAEYSLYDIDKSEAGAGDHRVISLSGMLIF